MTTTSSPPTVTPLGKLHDGAFGPEAAAGELVGRRDANDLRHTGQQFEILVIELSGRAYTGQYGLDSSGSAVNIESDFDHPLDNSLYLVVGGSFLHCNNHGYFSCPARLERAWLLSAPGVVELPWTASSSRCSARITSMMRS